jgi:hypothetical protein
MSTADISMIKELLQTFRITLDKALQMQAWIDYLQVLLSDC